MKHDKHQAITHEPDELGNLMDELAPGHLDSFFNNFMLSAQHVMEEKYPGCFSKALWSGGVLKATSTMREKIIPMINRGEAGEGPKTFFEIYLITWQITLEQECEKAWRQVN
ncbi:MAG: hypothetical protein ABSC17_09890 [Thermacetogeniaceae bacterium]